MKLSAHKWICVLLLLVSGILPLYTETVFVSKAHASIQSQSTIFVFGEIVHYLFSPVAFRDIVISGLFLISYLLLATVICYFRRSLMPLAVFVLFWFNIGIAFSILPAYFHNEIGYFKHTPLWGSYLLLVLVPLFNILVVWYFIRKSQDKRV